MAGEAKILAKAYHGTPIYGLSNKNREKLNTAISAINWGRAPLMGRERTLSLIYTSFKGGRLAPDVWFLERYVRLARRVLLSHPDRLEEWTRYRAKLRRRLVIQPDFVPVKGCPINVLTDELERNDIRLNNMDLEHDGATLHLLNSPLELILRFLAKAVQKKMTTRVKPRDCMQNMQLNIEATVKALNRLQKQSPHAAGILKHHLNMREMS